MAKRRKHKYPGERLREVARRVVESDPDKAYDVYLEEMQRDVRQAQATTDKISEELKRHREVFTSKEEVPAEERERHLKYYVWGMFLFYGYCAFKDGCVMGWVEKKREVLDDDRVPVKDREQVKRELEEALSPLLPDLRGRKQKLDKTKLLNEYEGIHKEVKDISKDYGYLGDDFIAAVRREYPDLPVDVDETDPSKIAHQIVSGRHGIAPATLEDKLGNARLERKLHHKIVTIMTPTGRAQLNELLGERPENILLQLASESERTRHS